MFLTTFIRRKNKKYMVIFTANHSSMTSGYASSELDSTSDFNSYHGNYESSSFFDEDSFFNDSYHAAGVGGQFSTDIFSMLEEGSISCRSFFYFFDKYKCIVFYNVS